MGTRDLQAMILMGPRALRMGPITDVFINWKFKDASPGRRSLVADESLLSFNGYMMQDGAV